MKYRTTVRMICLLLAAAGTLSAQPTWWSPSGIGGGIGNTLGQPVINPNDAREAYIASTTSVLFHTMERGASWNHGSYLRFTSPGSGLGLVAFAGVPSLCFAINNVEGRSRAARTTDGGDTWEDLASDPTGGGATWLAVDPRNERNLLVGTNTMFYYTTDGGATFVRRYQTGAARTVIGTFFDNDTVYIGTTTGFLSTSSAQWTSFTNPTISGYPNGQTLISMAPGRRNDSARILCVFQDRNRVRTVYMLELQQFGSKAKRLTTIPAGFDPLAAGMASNDVRTLYLAGKSSTGAPVVHKSTDAGATWSEVFKAPNNANVRTAWLGYHGDADWPTGTYGIGLTVAPRDAATAMLTFQGYVHATSDGGAHWRQAYADTSGDNPEGAATPTGRGYHSAGIETTKALDIAWADSMHMFAGYSDLHGIISNDAGATWGLGYSGLSANTTYRLATNPTTGTMYAATATVADLLENGILSDNVIDNAGGQVVYSSDNGKTWKLLRDFKHPVVSVALDPNNPTRLYACIAHSTEGGIYVSNNIQAGNLSVWQRLAAPPRTHGRPLAVYALRDGMLVASYAGNNNQTYANSAGTFVSTDGGATWEDRSPWQSQYMTKDLAIDMSDPLQKIWYVSAANSVGEGAGLGGVYRTTDRGRTWGRFFFLDNPSSCTVNPKNGNEVYICTNGSGLWYTADARDSTPFFSNVEAYSYHRPTRVAFDPYNNVRVWITSHGDGISYMLTVPPPEAPTLLSPTNGTGGVATACTLTWRAMPGATGYHVQVARTPNFTTPILDSANVAGTEIEVSGLAQGATYYWRAAARNQAGSGPWSAPWSFTTAQPNVVPAPVQYAPANDTVGVLQPYAFFWREVDHAVWYQLQIARDSLFATIVLDVIGNAPGNSIPVTGLPESTLLYWRVRAADGTDTSVWSATWRFTTAGPVAATPTENERAADGPALGLRIRAGMPARGDADVPIAITLPHAGVARLDVLDARGLHHATPASGAMASGTTVVWWRPGDAPSGLYFCVLSFEGTHLPQRIVIVR